ncbi:hypothetical protein QR685DRAFT_487888 [Neurospora intermedia]|uniref:Uncharacterized protein n=1 Tax=Neurospora intermedia TaxID=5142 RepID=A0ABR3DRD4_NEUIN
MSKGRPILERIGYLYIPAVSCYVGMYCTSHLLSARYQVIYIVWVCPVVLQGIIVTEK